MSDEIRVFSITQQFDGTGYAGRIHARGPEEAAQLAEAIGATVNGELREGEE